MGPDFRAEFARLERHRAAREWILSRVNRPRSKFKPRLRAKYASR
jgi:hypothetical protein